MSTKITRIDVWAGEVEDGPGAVAALLEPLARAGQNLALVFARRAVERPDRAVIFLASPRGAIDPQTARQAGLVKAGGFHALRIDTQDRAGLGADVARAVADAGVSMRDLSAIKVDDRAVVHVAFDTDNDAQVALRALQQVFGAS